MKPVSAIVFSEKNAMGQLSNPYEILLPAAIGDPQHRHQCIAIRGGSQCQNDVPIDSRRIASVEMHLSQNFRPPSFPTTLVKRLLCPECRNQVCARRATTRKLGQAPISSPTLGNDKSARAIYRDDQVWLRSIFDQMNMRCT